MIFWVAYLARNLLITMISIVNKFIVSVVTKDFIDRIQNPETLISCKTIHIKNFLLNV